MHPTMLKYGSSLRLTGGGSGYQGSTQCDSGLSCVKLNECKFTATCRSTGAHLSITGYSQCQTGGVGQPPVSTTAPVVTQPPPVSTTSSALPVVTGDPAPSVPAGQLTQMSNFGRNPSNISMFVYKPSSVKPRPGLLVALHPCGGTASVCISALRFTATSKTDSLL